MNAARYRLTKVTPTLIAVILLMMVLPTIATADSVTLRDSVQVSAASVRLSDLAELEGDEARRMADVQIIEFLPGQDELTVSQDEIRNRLSQRGVNWGKLVCRGPRMVKVRLATVEAPRVLTPSDINSQSQAVTAPVNRLTMNPEMPLSIGDDAEKQIRKLYTATVQDRIQAWVSEQNGERAEDLKMVFNVSDRQFLAQSVQDRRVEMTCDKSPMLGRVRICVRIFDGPSLAETTYLYVNIRVRRQVVVADRGLNRGQTISANDVKLATVWVDNNDIKPFYNPTELVGLEARKAIGTNQIIGTDQVASKVLIRRGDAVSIWYIDGAIKIKTVARAMEDGVLNQTIEVRDNKTKDSFLVNVIGKQQAVINVPRNHQLTMAGGAR